MPTETEKRNSELMQTLDDAWNGRTWKSSGHGTSLT